MYNVAPAKNFGKVANGYPKPSPKEHRYPMGIARPARPKSGLRLGKGDLKKKSRPSQISIPPFPPSRKELRVWTAMV